LVKTAIAKTNIQQGVALAGRHRAAFVEFSRRHGDFAIVSAATLLMIEGGRIMRTSVTPGAVAVAPVRATKVKQA